MSHQQAIIALYSTSARFLSQKDFKALVALATKG